MMWTRKLIKDNAKEVLKFNYWKAFFVSLVILFAGGDDIEFDIGSTNNYINFDSGESTIVFLVTVLIVITLRVFIGYILEIGGRKFFIKAAEGKQARIDDLIYYFASGRYLNLCAAMFLKSVYIFLWYLLFIIPGIVKTYAYRMVPYILADNPNIRPKRAIELSEEMTDGHKWDIFVLDLSFLGWYLLGALLLGVGTLFVIPYQNATNGELYLRLRKSVIIRNLTTTEELRISSDKV